MSAIAFAYQHAPEALRVFLPLLFRECRLPEAASQVDRAILREGIGAFGAELAAALRTTTASRTVETLEAAFASAGPVASEEKSANVEPAQAFVTAYDAGLVREGETTAAESTIRKIVLAALTTDRALDAGAVLRLLDGRGRPKTAPEVVARMRELHAQGRSYKTIARTLNTEFEGEAFSAEAVRAQLKPRAERRK